MEVLPSLDALPVGSRIVVTVGVFDGMHRGHKAVIARLTAAARELSAQPVVVTFQPHPEAVLRGSQPPLLSDPRERLAHLAAVGVSVTVVQPFDRAFAAQTAEAFLGRLAADRELVGLVMTPESAFGRDRAGTRAVVRELGERLGFRVIDVPALELDGDRVSSSAIRGLIEQGRLADARRLLGRRYAVVGEVVHGDGRGRQLGYPTANLAFPEPVVLPPNGIYAAETTWGGPDPLDPRRSALGVASLGVRPTFGPGERILEVHLLDFDEDLYGERVRVAFVRRQRGERRFPNVQGLVAQMDRDVVRARGILAPGSTPLSLPGTRTTVRLDGK